MRIVHMSDLHLTKDGIPIWETNTMDHFNKSIEIIRGMKDLDAIVVTGDISNDGSEWTYRYADRLFSSATFRPTAAYSVACISSRMIRGSGFFFAASAAKAA